MSCRHEQLTQMGLLNLLVSSVGLLKPIELINLIGLS